MPFNVYLAEKDAVPNASGFGEYRSFVHSDTIVSYYANETIGTTAYLKCHFLKNSINPKQVQTVLLIYLYINIYMMCNLFTTVTIPRF